MRLSVLLACLVVAACVDVPASIHAQFAAPGAADRSNYRPGRHGEARPAADEPVDPKDAPRDAGAASEIADGSVGPDASGPSSDGGSP